MYINIYRSIKGEVAGLINMGSVIDVRKEPLTCNPSPFVLDSKKATLNLIDKSLYLLSSELPPSCKVKKRVAETDIKMDREVEREILT